MNGHCILIVAIVGCVLFGHWAVAIFFTVLLLASK